MKYAMAVLLLAASCMAQNFWTTERFTVTSVLVAESTYDGYTTQVLTHRGYGEANPLARPLVTRGTAGQVAASALGVGVVLGVQYASHRMGHERVANWVGRIAVAGEGVNCARQYELMRGSR